MPIRPYLTGGTFEPEDIEVMSLAFEALCKALEIGPSAGREREVVAARVIELARSGERSATRLIEAIVQEKRLFDPNSRCSAFAI